MATDDATKNTLRENGRKPARITRGGRLFIGDDEFPYPIAAESISVAPTKRAGSSNNRLNLLTLSLFVGEVTIEAGKNDPQS